MFRIGQKVVCVDIRSRGVGLAPRYCQTVLPVLGGVYTVRDIFDAAPYGHHGEAGLLLDEIVNSVLPYTACNGEPVVVEQFWLGFRFRPVRTTDIEVFERMLEPVPAREQTELVDA